MPTSVRLDRKTEKLLEVEAFVSDEREDAYERLVDRVLASPHYAERWARHWLDLARYADSNGFTIDGARSIWPYRDWVVRAIAEEMPFDQFTIEQLAGDLCRIQRTLSSSPPAFTATPRSIKKAAPRTRKTA